MKYVPDFGLDGSASISGDFAPSISIVSGPSFSSKDGVSSFFLSQILACSLTILIDFMSTLATSSL